MTLTRTKRLMTDPAYQIVDRAYAEYNGITGITAVIPIDDTIPQQGEGTQLLTATISPKATTNRLRVTVSGSGGTASIAQSVCAIFRDAIANALHSVVISTADASNIPNFSTTFEFVPGTTSPVNINVRFGPNTGGTFYPNATVGGARLLGGNAKITLVVEEIAA